MPKVEKPFLSGDLSFADAKKDAKQSGETAVANPPAEQPAAAPASKNTAQAQYAQLVDRLARSHGVTWGDTAESICRAAGIDRDQFERDIYSRRAAMRDELLGPARQAYFDLARRMAAGEQPTTPEIEQSLIDLNFASAEKFDRRTLECEAARIAEQNKKMRGELDRQAAAGASKVKVGKTVAETLAELRSVEVEDRQSARAAYGDLVVAVAAGEEQEIGEIDIVIREAGRTVDQFEQHVKFAIRRNELTAAQENLDKLRAERRAAANAYAAWKGRIKREAKERVRVEAAERRKLSRAVYEIEGKLRKLQEDLRELAIPVPWEA